MILDKLIEKKDLDIYFMVRIKKLQFMNLKEFPKERREKIAERIKGRIEELKSLRLLIKQTKLKEMSKRYWRDDIELKGGGK